MRVLFVLWIIFFSESSTFAAAPVIRCLANPNSGGVSAKSDAAFWKGIDGAQFIDELTDANHSQYIKSNPKAFVMYYATWCGYSKKARNGFAASAKKFNPKIKFGAVDCDKARNSCNSGQHPVNGYPTFYFYQSGSWVEEYMDDTTAQAFSNYLSRK